MSATRWKITIEYDGRAFAGWQRQENAPSVQQVIEQAIHDFCGQAIRVHAAGRTDAGVHAHGQVAHFDLDYGARPLTPYNFAKGLNALMRPHPVAILHAEQAHPDFHARFDALNKLYIYRIVNRAAPPVLEAGRVTHVRPALDVAAMDGAAKLLLGHHDFTTFRDSDCQAKSPMRTLDRLDVRARPYDAHGGQEIMVEAEARSFLHHQVRNMVGTLILVGQGKWRADDVAAALAARDRTRGGPTAPPDGLYLARIDYPDSNEVRRQEKI